MRVLGDPRDRAQRDHEVPRRRSPGRAAAGSPTAARRRWCRPAAGRAPASRAARTCRPPRLGARELRRHARVRLRRFRARRARRAAGRVPAARGDRHDAHLRRSGRPCAAAPAAPSRPRDTLGGTMTGGGRPTPRAAGRAAASPSSKTRSASASHELQRGRPLAPLTVVVGSSAVRTRVGDLLVRRLGGVANVARRHARPPRRRPGRAVRGHAAALLAGRRPRAPASGAWSRPASWPTSRPVDGPAALRGGAGAPPSPTCARACVGRRTPVAADRRLRPAADDGRRHGRRQRRHLAAALHAYCRELADRGVADGAGSARAAAAVRSAGGRRAARRPLRHLRP